MIADDHAVLRQGLRCLLSMEPDMEVIGEAGDGQQAVELANHMQPDIVLMDVNMPLLSGVEATRQITTAFPSIRIIGLSMHEEPLVMDAMSKAGAVAFLSKGCGSQELFAALRAAIADHSVT